MFNYSGLSAGFLIGVLIPMCVSGQLLDPVSYRMTTAPDSIASGHVFHVEVVASIDTGWHLYSILNDPDAGPFPTQFTPANNQLLIAGEVIESEAEIEYDPNFDTDLGWHSSQANFSIPIAFHPDLTGEEMIELEVFYQACDSISCLPPKTKSFSLPVFLLASDGDIYEGFLPNRGSIIVQIGLWAGMAGLIVVLLYRVAFRNNRQATGS